MSISLSGALPSVFHNLKSGAVTAKSPEAKTAEQKFLDYAEMTPAERMHAAMLAQMGVTEDEFKAMDPAAQQKIEEKIREMIKQQAAENGDKRTGLITDMSV
jgi:TPP-dependent pyruvate/acetoin dehydrogenase alpha subunit